jgi:4'-phosphopantetheinyl transferase
MPVVLQKNAGEKTQLILWRIEEETIWFQDQLQLDENELRTVQAIQKPQRKIHWLSSRFLIRQLLKTDRFIELKEDEFGKPFIANFDLHISISHAGNYSALMMSEKFTCGLDIEISGGKAGRISAKFMNENELQQIHHTHRFWQFTACWCCKEVLFKWYGRKQIDFRKNLLLENIPQPFSGIIQGRIQKEHFEATLDIHYETVDELIVAYTLR